MKLQLNKDYAIKKKLQPAASAEICPFSEDYAMRQEKIVTTTHRKT